MKLRKQFRVGISMLIPLCWDRGEAASGEKCPEAGRKGRRRVWSREGRDGAEAASRSHPLIPLPHTEQGLQCVCPQGRLNSRSSLGNWAAELLLGHEVTMRTERKKVLVTVGSAGITDVCEAQVFPPPLTLRQPGLQSLAGGGARGPVRREEREEDGRAHSALGMGCGGRIRNHGAQMPPFLDWELHLMELAGL